MSRVKEGIVRLGGRNYKIEIRLVSARLACDPQLSSEYDPRITVTGYWTVEVHAKGLPPNPFASAHVRMTIENNWKTMYNRGFIRSKSVDDVWL